MPATVQSQSSVMQAAYDTRLREAGLTRDAAQLAVVAGFETLRIALEEPGRGFFGKLFHGAQAPVRSLYLFGPVGRGKSFLMDLFYATVQTTLKRRVHFHAFMQEVHALTHLWRQRIREEALSDDLMERVATEIAARTRLFCLDELQVTDVADAMILSRLFTALLARGVTFVITSNRPPEELYQSGLQRETFLEFVRLVRARMDVTELASPQDYRMQQLRALRHVYLFPLTPANDAAFDAMLVQLIHGADMSPLTLEVSGHRLPVPACYGGVACFSFADLCDKPLGPGDYLLIATRFHTVFLRAIPVMTPDKRNESRRFVSLIDALYDHRVKLIATAQAAPENLYPAGDGAFEFARLVSRLAEMRSQQYLNLPHLP